jgi:amphi-Trp domain-containing protein
MRFGPSILRGSLEFNSARDFEQIARWPIRIMDKGDLKLAARKKRAKRDVEKDYPAKQLVAKLRRLADCIEQGKRFRIQVAGERVLVPPNATISIEHERGKSEEEIEFQLKWPLGDQPAS